MEEIMCVLTLW